MQWRDPVDRGLDSHATRGLAGIGDQVVQSHHDAAAGAALHRVVVDASGDGDRLVVQAGGQLHGCRQRRAAGPH